MAGTEMAPKAADPASTDSAVGPKDAAPSTSLKGPANEVEKPATAGEKDDAPSTSLKCPASEVEDSATADETSASPEASTSAAPAKAKRPPKKPRHMSWDVERENLPEGISPFQEKVPVEVADLILGSEVLNVRDHLALASTCKLLRNAYQADDLWPVLNKYRPLPGRDLYHRAYAYAYPALVLAQNADQNTNEAADARAWKIMSGAKPIPATGVVVVADRGPVKIETHRTTFAGKKVKKTPLAIQKEREAAEAARHYVVMGKGQDAAIREVNSDARINKTDAKATYKVSDAQLAALAHIKKSNYGAAPRQLFLIAAVEALALRAHGGVEGHKAHLAKLAATAEKVKATKTKNGTLPKKKPGARRGRWGLSYLYGFDDYDYDYDGGCACGECGYDFDYY